MDVIIALILLVTFLSFTIIVKYEIRFDKIESTNSTIIILWYNGGTDYFHPIRKYIKICEIKHK